MLLALIGIGSAFMAGQNAGGVRKGRVKSARHYAWMVRAVACLAALAFRHAFDSVMMGAWRSPRSHSRGGWWQADASEAARKTSRTISFRGMP